MLIFEYGVFFMENLPYILPIISKFIYKMFDFLQVCIDKACNVLV